MSRDTKPPLAAPPQLGPRYEILTLLGTGGFGSVYRARHRSEHGLEKIVAIKFPAEHLPETALDRLRDEARVLATVRHRAIVQVEDLVPHGSGWAIVMEFVDGLDLERILEKRPMPVGVALEVVAEVASALATAQAARGPGGRPLLLQHRDIKPGNIMITPAGEVKLLDFGIAHANLGELPSQEASDCGTLAFVAPERLMQENHVHSDIYSLGVVLWEMVTSERFGPADFHPEKHREHVIRRLRALEDPVPRELMVLLDEMLDFDPRRRPSLREVERRAEEIRRHTSLSLRSWATARLPELLGRRHTTLPPSNRSIEASAIAALDPSSASEPPEHASPEAARLWFAGTLLGWSALTAAATLLSLAFGGGADPRPEAPGALVDSGLEEPRVAPADPSPR